MSLIELPRPAEGFAPQQKPELYAPSLYDRYLLDGGSDVSRRTLEMRQSRYTDRIREIRIRRLTNVLTGLAMQYLSAPDNPETALFAMSSPTARHGDSGDIQIMALHETANRLSGNAWYDKAKPTKYETAVNGGSLKLEQIDGLARIMLQAA